jgi:hypothetical protein
MLSGPGAAYTNASRATECGPESDKSDDDHARPVNQISLVTSTGTETQSHERMAAPIVGGMTPNSTAGAA